MTQSSRAVPETGVDSGVASASVRPEPSSVESMAPLVAELRALADCDSRAGEPLGKCMRKAADKIERLSEHADYIEAQWLAKADALSAKDRELAEARERVSALEALTATPLFSHRALTAKLREIIATRFGVRFLDPPDGGDVPVHDQVGRMAAALTTAERQRDEAMAALREKEERVKALEEALGPFAEQSKRFDDAADKFGVRRRPDDYRPSTSFTHGDLRRARSVLSSVQPVSGSREQRGNEEGRV